jgi:hypothetical protein
LFIQKNSEKEKYSDIMKFVKMPCDLDDSGGMSRVGTTHIKNITKKRSSRNNEIFQNVS